MEVYLEVIKKLSEEEEMYELEQGFRKKVSSREEAIELYNNLKQLGIFDDLKPYIARIHYHGHSPEGNESCKIEKIEEV